MWNSADWYNALEVLLWSGFGLEILRRSSRAPRSQRPRRIIAGVAFLAFALTDAVEIHTGAWWTPWWLPVWKGLCIATLLWLYAWYRCERKKLPLRTVGKE